MIKFNEVAQSVLKENSSKDTEYYRQISDILSKKGIRAFEQKEILDIVAKLINISFKEGVKAADPFKK